MRSTTSDDELRRLITGEQGFLVKVWSGRQATVHPVEHLCYNLVLSAHYIFNLHYV
jgi:hypothetical protein